MGGRRRRRDWGVVVTVLLTPLTAAYAVGFVLGWGGADARVKLTYALYLPLTFGPMVLAWRVAGRRSLPAATRRAWRPSASGSPAGSSPIWAGCGPRRSAGSRRRWRSSSSTWAAPG